MYVIAHILPPLYLVFHAKLLVDVMLQPSPKKAINTGYIILTQHDTPVEIAMQLLCLCSNTMVAALHCRFTEEQEAKYIGMQTLQTLVLRMFTLTVSLCEESANALSGNADIAAIHEYYRSVNTLLTNTYDDVIHSVETNSSEPIHNRIEAINVNLKSLKYKGLRLVK